MECHWHPRWKMRKNPNGHVREENTELIASNGAVVELITSCITLLVHLTNCTIFYWATGNKPTTYHILNHTTFHRLVGYKPANYHVMDPSLHVRFTMILSVHLSTFIIMGPTNSNVTTVGSRSDPLQTLASEWSVTDILDEKWGRTQMVMYARRTRSW